MITQARNAYSNESYYVERDLRTTFNLDEGQARDLCAWVDHVAMVTIQEEKKQSRPRTIGVPRSFEEITAAILPSTVFSIDLGNGVKVAWAHRHESLHSHSVRRVASEFNCNTCVSNAKFCTSIAGPHGAMFFEGEQLPSNEQTVDQLSQLAAETCQGEDYTLVLVSATTFPPSKFTGHGSVEEFSHWTIVPEAVTTPEMISRMAPLWAQVQHSVIGRLSKFLCGGARETMRIIEDVIRTSGMARPEYWSSTCRWILDIQAKFIDFGQMTKSMREECSVYAMAIGNASGGVHFNFQTAESFIGFMAMESPEAIADLMDRRSDPRTNQISQVARAKAKFRVKTKCTASLVWDGNKYPDDLDIRAKTPYGTVSFQDRTVYNDTGHEVAHLDFDAGIGGREAEPVENISFSAAVAGYPIDIFIDNFSRRTRGSDVHCHIIVQQEGQDTKEIPVVWPKDRRSHDYLFVLNHTFARVKEQPVELSVPRALAARTQNAEFIELFGTPTSAIATSEDLAPLGFRCVKSVPLVESEFESLVHAATRGRKIFLSDRMKQQPPTSMEELWKRMAEGPVNISIHLPDHTPGYVTRITVAGECTLRPGCSTIVSPCFFASKFELPTKPSVPGNARLDGSWVQNSTGGNVAVHALGKINGTFFMVLAGARLPDDPMFPLSAGFYPHDLSEVAHKHRSQWSFLNASLKPTMPMAHFIPAIGAFLTGATATVYVNEKKLLLKV